MAITGEPQNSVSPCPSLSSSETGQISSRVFKKSLYCGPRATTASWHLHRVEAGQGGATVSQDWCPMEGNAQPRKDGTLGSVGHWFRTGTLAAEPNKQPASRGRSQGALSLLLTCSQGWVLVEASLSMEPGPYHEHPGLARTTTNCRSLCSSKQVPQDKIQSVSDIGLQENLKSNKRNTVIYLQGSSHKAVNWFLNINS